MPQQYTFPPHPLCPDILSQERLLLDAYSNSEQGIPPSRESSSLSSEIAPSLSCQNGPWLQSEAHEGLLTMHDGKRRLFKCKLCDYEGDRLGHSKLHYIRIHLQNGTPMIKKRKYVGSVLALAVPENNKRPSNQREMAQILTFHDRTISWNQQVHTKQMHGKECTEGKFSGIDNSLHLHSSVGWVSPASPAGTSASTNKQDFAQDSKKQDKLPPLRMKHEHLLHKRVRELRQVDS
jgi:hypothetical protein